MPGKILVVHRHADFYARTLRRAFPDAPIVPIDEEVHANRALPAAAAPHLADAAGIVSIGRWMSPDVLAAAPNLRWFQCLITGTDHLAPVLRGHGVQLTNARGIHGVQMSEIAILHMFAYTRQFPRTVRSQAAHAWDRFTPRVLAGRTVVVLGVGAIAEALAKICKAFGMRTVGISRTVRPIDGFDAVVPRERLLEAAAEADFLVVLVPFTPENEHIVGAQVLAAMKPDACLVNIARGGVVDEAALIEALKNKRIAFAGLDVFKTTPLPQDSPLWDMENVFVTPMLGGQSDRYDEDAVGIVETNLGCFLRGEPEAMMNIVPT